MKTSGPEAPNLPICPYTIMNIRPSNDNYYKRKVTYKFSRQECTVAMHQKDISELSRTNSL